MGLIEELAAQVRGNCRISDARAWGFYSVCGLLLRLRELYKWERGLEPWDQVAQKDILPWIGLVETEWQQFEEAELIPLEIGGHTFDPFDTESVNALLEPHGCLYGAGHGLGLKPLFVLGRVAERRLVDGFDVVVLGEEFVRDLSPVPAMSRDGAVIARRDPMKWFLWSKLEEAGMKAEPGVAAGALAEDGLELKALLADPKAHAAHLEEIARRETEVAVHHEVGELREEARLEGRWSRLLGRACGAKAELLARGLKDVLADTGEGGRLAHIIEKRAAASLGLYAMLTDGLHRRLFPELSPAFLALREDGDWGRVEEVRLAVHGRLRGFVEPLLALLAEELAPAEAARRADALEEEMLGPD